MKTKRRLALALMAAVTFLLVPIPRAAAAPLPGGWCGSDELAVDRPDLVAPPQVHVIYAYPTDVADRFGDVSRSIVRDLAGVDTWWRSQDPTRAPRFDLADFGACDSEFGALDLSSVALAQDSGALNVEDGSDFADSVGDDLTRAGFTDSTKKYLVFYDGPAPDNLCGRSASSSVRGGPRLVSFIFLQGGSGCAIGGYGTGNGWPARTAAHELIHGLNDFFTEGGAPNACEDHGHVCDSTADVLSSGSIHPSPLLSGAILDVGNDDYYNHPGAWWDVRNSSWLVHLESPPGVLSVVTAGTGGQVSIAPFGRVCPHECAQRYDGGTPVRLSAVVQPGYRLLRWSGACSGSSDFCDTIVNENGTAVTATFGPAVRLVAKVVGPGRIYWSDGGRCGGRCSLDLIPGSQVHVVAVPGARARFAGWSGLCAGNKRACTIAVALAAKHPAITAVFRAKQPSNRQTVSASREP